MKLSIFNYTANNSKKAVIWNTLRGSLIEFDMDYYNRLKNLKFNLIEKKELDILKDNGILVDDDVDELNDVLKSREQYIKTSKNKVTFTIALTQQCNARCYYCYQASMGFKKTVSSQENYEKIIDFILSNSKNRKIEIIWFGGEPLMKMDAIDYISNKLLEYKVDFSSSIITNGLLLNKININLLKSVWKVKMIQLTFDGLYERHDKRKNYMSNENVFDNLIQCIEKILENKIKVDVRINLSKVNYMEADEIFSYFFTRFKKNKNFVCYYSYIIDDTNKQKFAFTTEEQININEQIFKKISKYRNFSLPRRRNIFCGVQNNQSFFLDIFGNIYICEHHFWNFDKKIGKISDFACGKNSEMNIYENLSDKCINCVFLPVCQGGCVRNQINECPPYIDNSIKYINSLLEEVKK